MQSIKRPSPKEGEDDLIRQDKLLHEQGKRRPVTDTDEECPISSLPDIEQNVKKKKTGIVDATILKEAVSMEAKTGLVLGKIVERNVPTLSPNIRNWKPSHSAHGFPQAPKLEFKKNMEKNKDASGKPRKSLYMQQMERNEKKFETKENLKAVCGKMESNHDEKLEPLENQRYILSNASLKSEDVSNIHAENLSKLSTMSHEERLEERNSLMSNLSQKEISFIQSLHMRKSLKEASVSNVIKEGDLDCMSTISEPDGSEMEISDEPESPKEEMTPCKHVSFDNKILESMDVADDASANPPIDPNEAKKWVHMDKVEIDKLRWATDLPPVKPLLSSEGFIARFNFNGDILPYDSDVSWREGLHHHGDEPGRAGYTIDELFLFSRSQVIQQRHVGLGTLANILRNSREGLYDVGLETSIIQLLIDAGLVLLLRFALDDSTALVYQEALKGLYHLLCSHADEQCLSNLEVWEPLGGVEPGISSLVHRKEKDRSELDAEEKELKDYEILQLDVVRALIRMDTHLRLRYFIETIRPSPPDIIHILGILGRIARHSLTAAWTLVSTPRLIKAVVDNFVPCNVGQLLTGANVLQMDSVYGVPMRHAVSFLKILCSRGRQLATIITSDYDIMSSIRAYVSMEPNTVCIPIEEALNLSQEAYGLWAKLLVYGLPKAEESFSSFFPQLLRQLFFYRDKVDINQGHEENKFNYNIGAYMMHVANKALCVGSLKEILLSKRGKKGEDEDEIVPPSLDWESFIEITRVVEVCLLKWMSQLAREEIQMSFSAKRLVGAFCTYLNVYYKKCKDQKSFEGVSFINKIDELYYKTALPFLTSNSFELLVEKMHANSALISNLKPGNDRDSRNLATLACVTHGGALSPVIRSDSPFPLILPFISLVHTLHSLNPSLKNGDLVSFLNSIKIKSYLMGVLSSPKLLSNQWLTRVEVYNLFYIIKLAALKCCDDPVLFHKISIALLPIIHKGDENIVKELLTDVICNSRFIEDLSNVEIQIDSLTMKDFKPLKSPALKQPILSTIQLTNKLKASLPSIGAHFFRNIVDKAMVQQCSIKLNCIYFLINNFIQDEAEDSHVLHRYWTLNCLKLMKLTKNTPDESKSGMFDQSSPEDMLLATRCLQMTYMLLKYRSDSITHTDPMGWLRYLSLVFIASNDLFLDVLVSSYLQACLVELLQDGMYANLDYNWSELGLPRCIEWHKELVEQYNSVSYGDSTFALFIIIPLQKHWPDDFKIALFGDLSEAIPFVRLSCSDVQQFIPLQQFLVPSEESEEVVSKYRSALQSQLIDGRRTPFLYYFASHHVSQYIKKNSKKPSS